MEGVALSRVASELYILSRYLFFLRSLVGVSEIFVFRIIRSPIKAGAMLFFVIFLTIVLHSTFSLE